jgi:mTERF domain-containing protein
MKYDTIGVEEMEDENSFDTNRLAGQVQDEYDEDEDSDYGDTDDEYME